MAEHPTAGDQPSDADRDKELDELDTEAVEDLEVDQDAEDVEGGKFPPTAMCASNFPSSCEGMCQQF